MSLSAKTLETAKQVLDSDGVICYPTEGVWGLGCHPQSQRGFEKLLQIKSRDINKGVILIAATITQLSPYVTIAETLKPQLLELWPGFITCVLPKSADCPSYLSGRFDTIAARVSAYSVICDLCYRVGSALISTSANRSGESPVRSLAEAKQTFNNNVDYYVDAKLGGEQKSSKIIQFVDNQMITLRE